MRPQFNGVSSIRSPCRVIAPSGPINESEPPVPSNVPDTIIRVTLESTGIEYERSVDADAQRIVSGNNDVCMMRDDWTTSAVLNGNGCPPVSVAVLT
jgi:hypothetical protein